MILLDTNALIWLLAGHRRGQPLLRDPRRLYVSPVSLLELKVLDEIGKVRIRDDARLEDDPRFAVDDPPSLALFNEALHLAWTRDPFDRLLVAHAQLRKWRLATADGNLLDRLGPSQTIEL
jgi:PIN domain nuclease of toxin-antitoxin system